MFSSILLSKQTKKKPPKKKYMLQDRFTQVSILYIEKSDTKNINKDIILKQFAEKYKYIILKSNIKMMLIVITY